MHEEVSSFAPTAAIPIRMTSEADAHDRLIAAVALRRDREAFACLFDYYAPRLKAYLMKAGATASAAEDFAQDAMLTVWRKAELFDARKARAATWIFTIARNRRLDALRREKRPLPAPEIELDGEAPDRPDRLLDAAEDADRVRDALMRLKPEQAQVLRLAFFMDHPHSEIARRLDLPLGTVKSRIRTAMIRLRHLLDPASEGDRS